jgi:hypothetical protein
MRAWRCGLGKTNRGVGGLAIRLAAALFVLAALVPGAVQIAEATSHFNQCDLGSPYCATLTIELRGNGSGTVRTYGDASFSATTNRIDCRREGGDTTGKCAAAYYLGPDRDPVTVYIGYSPDSGSCVLTEGSCQQTLFKLILTFAADTTYSRESFQLINPRSLEIVKFGSGNGSVSSSPVGIDCGGKCKSDFPAGSTINVTATPNGASQFVGWSGPCAGQGATCVFTLSENTVVVASFEPAATPTPSPTPSTTAAVTPPPTTPPTPSSASTPTPVAQSTQAATVQPAPSTAPTESPMPIAASADPQLSPDAHLEPSHSPPAVGGLPAPTGGEPPPANEAPIPVLEQPAAAGTGALDLTPIFLAIVLAGGMIGAGIFAGLRWGRRPNA